jgi:hypothetical protein
MASAGTKARTRCSHQGNPGMETTMKTLTLFGALLFGLVVVQASAEARESLRKNETYCLESSQGGGSDGGGTFLQCRYETMAQCIAS